MNPILLVNGASASSIEISDRGFQYGDGVFTTLPVRHGVPVFLPPHLARLERDCGRLIIPFPGRDLLAQEAGRLCAAKPDGVLKIQITRGGGGRGYRPPDQPSPTRVLGLHPLPEYPADLAEKGVEVRFCQTRLGINPALAGIKHMNRLEQILARAEWPLGDIREGLMLDAEGHVTEGTMTNLFLAHRGKLVTPKLDLCGVAGVMRAVVLDAAAELGLAVEETRLVPAELFGADELFLTNSVIGVWPIRRIEDRDFPVGPVTTEISRWLMSRIQSQIQAGSAAAFTG
ncbi:aminodeoxychorismate lyase [Methylomagnum sp.]